jgi:hypothetical protein
VGNIGKLLTACNHSHLNPSNTPIDSLSVLHEFVASFPINGDILILIFKIKVEL